MPLRVSADDSGSCGENLSWNYIESTHTLTISGSGGMTYYGASQIPWANLKPEIKTVEIKDGVKYLCASAFSGCTELTSVKLSSSLTSISANAFYGCSKLSSISIPDGVQQISGNAFANCISLIDIKIPNSVNSIQSDSFAGTAWYNNQPDGVVYAGLNAYTYKGRNNMPEGTSIVIKEGTIGISGMAFAYCTNLSSIDIPNSVTNLEYGAFTDCSGLRSVVLPKGITKMGYSVFSGCSGLTSLTIQCAPTSMGLYIFDKCDNIKEVTFDCDRVKSFFKGFTSIEKVMLKEDVTQIDDFAFQGCSGITSITIPQGVTYLGYGSFSHCSDLTSITFLCDPTNMDYSVSHGVFSGCNNIKEVTFGCKTVLAYCQDAPIEKVTLTEDVTTIGDAAFRGCTNLTSITLPSKLITIGESAFAQTALSSIIIPNSVTSIGRGAFENSKLESAVVGNGVKQLPERVFGLDKSMKSLTIGSNVISISSTAFKSTYSYYSNTPIKTLWMPNTPPNGCSYANGKINYVPNTQYSSLNQQMVYPFISSIFEINGIRYVPVNPAERTCDAIDCTYSEATDCVHIGKTVTYMGIELTVKGVKDYVCYQNPYLKEVEVSCDGDIYPYAFYGCTSLEKLTATNNGIIGNFAFGNVEGAYTANLNNCSNIANKAFSESTGLKQLEIGDSVKDIGEHAFEGCSALTTIMTNNSGFIGERAFYGCSALASITINNATNLGVNIFSGCKALQKAKVYNTGILDVGAFYGCTALETIEIGDQVRSIEKNAFSNCENLKSIVIPNSVEILGDNCFYNCISMTSAVLGNGVKNLSMSLFSGCKSLVSIEMGNGVTNIGASAFKDCASLSEFTIPNTVSTVGDYAFSGCRGIRNVVMEDKNTELTLGSNGSSPLFSDCPLESVYIGRNIVYSASSAKGYSPFYRNTTLQSITITNRETEISPNEFYGCTNLKEVNIGDGVTTIGARAFSGCSSLTTFAFGRSVQDIGQEAFSDCSAMTSLTSFATNPPVCASQALDDINKWGCVLTIPAGTLSAYQSADQWKNFFFIEEQVFTGFNVVSKDEDNHKKEYYNLAGTKNSKPKRGLNILKMSNGAVKKILVR